MSHRGRSGPSRRVGRQDRWRDRWRGRWWRVHGVLGVALTALAVSLAVALTSSVAVVAADTAVTLTVLQMNLCNSGGAKACYSGGEAVRQAVANIHRYRPHLVTVQEICRNDVHAAQGWGPLAQAMADLHGRDRIRVEFTPARNRNTGDAYRGCVNGEMYGHAVIHQGTGREVHRGWYTNQGRSIEMRAWTCVTVVKGRLTACATHLSPNGELAMRQCRELMSIVASARWAQPEVFIAGDLNLRSGQDSPNDVRNCVSAGYDHRGDDSVQHVLFTGGIVWERGGHEPMNGTDHPLLHARLRV